MQEAGGSAGPTVSRMITALLKFQGAKVNSSEAGARSFLLPAQCIILLNPACSPTFVGLSTGAVKIAASRVHQVVAGCLQRIGSTEEGPMHQDNPLAELRSSRRPSERSAGTSQCHSGGGGGGPRLLSDTDRPPSAELGPFRLQQHENPLSSQWGEGTGAVASFEEDDPDGGPHESHILAGTSKLDLYKMEPSRPPPRGGADAPTSFEVEDQIHVQSGSNKKPETRDTFGATDRQQPVTLGKSFDAEREL